MMCKAVAAFAFLLAAGAAQAQDAPPAPAPASTPQTAPQPSESHIAAAFDLLDASHAMNNKTEDVDRIISHATSAMKRENPTMGDAEISRFGKILSDEMAAHLPDFNRAIAVVYAQHFSEADLHALAGFYRGDRKLGDFERSDLGKRYMATQSAMENEARAAGMVWAEQIAREALEKFRKTLSKGKEHA